MISSANIAGGGDQEKRSKLDFYPTPPEPTIALMDFLRLERSMILEPACGNGAMSKVLSMYGHMVVSEDIRDDTGYGVGGIDYLSMPVRGFDAVITNPPFSHAEAFIRKALKDAPLVAMLLKAHYFHAQKRVALFDEYPPAWVLPLAWRPNFTEGKGATMDCSWYVWQRGVTETRYKILTRPESQQP